MHDTERAELGERVAVVEALLAEHNKGALARKAEISLALKEINEKLSSQSCAVHTVNMLALRGDITSIKEKDLPRIEKRIEDGNLNHGSRLTFLEKAYWTGMGGLAVLMALLKWVIK